MPSSPFRTVPTAPHRLFVFGAVLLAMFLAALDMQVVTTALPTIVADLGEIERFSWISTAYLLASSLTMPLYGKFSDLFGRKLVFLASVTVFIFGSIACALSTSMTGLIVARFFQGFGGGGLMVLAFSVIADLFEPRERARYQGYAGGVFVVGSVIGPVLGGAMSDAFGWRSIFTINLPIGIIVLFALAFMLPRRLFRTRPKIDVAGAFLVGGAITGVVLSCDLDGRALAWTSPAAIGLAVFALACIVALPFVERRAAEPILPPFMFREPTIVKCLIISVATGTIALGLLNYLGLFFQTVAGATPTQSGLLFLPTPFGVAITSTLVGVRISQTGRYKWFPVASMAMAICALCAYAMLGPGTPWIVILAVVGFFGISIGMTQQVTVLAAQNAAPHSVVGTVTGAISLARMCGSLTGLSLYGAILTNRLDAALAASGLDRSYGTLSPAEIAALPEPTHSTVLSAFDAASTAVFYAAIPMLVVGLAAALLLKDTKLAAVREVEDVPGATPGVPSPSG